MNTQNKSKQDLSLDGVTKPLQVTDIFKTIQGEGPHSGRAATFIRLAGCNLTCYWCDTKYDAKYDMFLPTIMNKVKNHKTNLIVITGGEPFRQNIVPLIKALLDCQKHVQIETSGSLSQPGIPWGWIDVVCSPKTRKVHPDMKWASAWKYILQAGCVASDGLPNASTQVIGVKAKLARPLNETQVYVSPVDDLTKKSNTDEVVQSALNHNYRVSLQIHKILGVE